MHVMALLVDLELAYKNLECTLATLNTPDLIL